MSLKAGRSVPKLMRLPAETYELRGSENIAGCLQGGPEAVVALNSVFRTFMLIIGFRLRPLPSYLMQRVTAASGLFENYISSC